VSRETVIEDRHENGVLVLTMNRPRQKNAFNNRMWREMRDALADAQADDEVRAVVVTGAEGAFSAGQDLGEMAAPPAGEPPGFPSFMDRLTAFDKPLLAAVNGVGVGIGLTFLLHCDIVHVAEGARLRAPFVPLGVVPEAGSSYLLPVLLGHSRAAEILFTAEWIDARRALELGIASRVFEPDDLLPATLVRAAEIARQPLGALRYTKQLLLAIRADAVRAARAREDAAFARRVGSPENVEAVRAFFEKRPADFRKVPPTDREP
jgi:enoyl-CoA hydratase/carnithine racemase